jgi:hypothetical protein
VKAGDTAIPYAAWTADVGTTKAPLVDGWGKFTGTNGQANVGMRCEVTPTVGANIQWHFTARSDHARDIRSLVGSYWSNLKAVPDLTLYPEARRYHLSFTSTASNPLRVTSAQGPLKENFELADDAAYKVVL